MQFRNGILAFLLLLPGAGHAQIMGNVIAEKEDGKMIITYDLRGTQPGTWIEIKLYGSHNSFKAPIENATGDVGRVTPGMKKRIEWAYGNELDYFNDKISFEVEAESVPFLSSYKSSLRRGKNNVINWSGGRPQDSLNIELRSPNKEILWQGSYINQRGTTSFKLPQELALGEGYELQLATQYDQKLLPIQMKRKVSRFWIVAPFIAAGGAAAYFFLMPEEEEPLPVAPEPPGGN